ncbi:hypothetical protein [Ruminococcus bromii]|jgi:hypothetical protein|uniref:hypothetical protein n=1 Tax=Ruminococcus bromii TaxID=40518 RepID=UPI0020597003|nr:hypothetical protein [Ruminococcus bromii]DAE77595.1 MAG TPA: hypothetical protein [Caudoviricetes sp.]
MRDKYHLYLTNEGHRAVISSLIEQRNRLIFQGKYTDVVDELLVKFTRAKMKKIKVKEV